MNYEGKNQRQIEIFASYEHIFMATTVAYHKNVLPSIKHNTYTYKEFIS